MLRNFKLSLFVVLLMSLFSCSYAQKGNELSPKEFDKALKIEKQPQLVDVRTPDEYNELHIEGAENIDWNGDDFDEEVSRLDKTQPVYVYCQSGRRSAKAAKHMRELGFTKVYELQGGILGWEQSGLLKQD
jgi:rhodanese-related sulfurtransferase